MAAISAGASAPDLTRARFGRVRGFAPWRPQKKTRLLLADVSEVLEEYRAFLPLTCRQIFYRLVGLKGFEKTEAAYARLCEAIGRGRRAGLIPFGHIRDDGASRYEPPAWDGPEAFLRDARERAERFRLDRQQGQPVRLWLACEASGMAPLPYRAAAPFGLPVLSSGGFDSLSAKHDLAQELAAYPEAEVLHIGDLDPSGVHLFQSMAEDVAAMAQALSGGCVRFSRLAVTPRQAEAMELPTAPPKTTDKRAFHGETVQAEAIAPDVLSELVKDAIAARLCMETFSATLEREAEHFLHRQRQPVDALAEIYWPRRHKDFHRPAMTEHHDAAARAARIARISWPSLAPEPARITISPTTISRSDPATADGASAALSSTTSSAKTGKDATLSGTTRLPLRNCLRQS